MKDFNRRNLLTAGLGLGAVAAPAVCFGQPLSRLPT
ncbi:hypothetical protein PJL18_03237 [Paenarthrobacter nicotinovorans]|nr:hypothetical protein [Paenarthrobacter nicotinovorans]